MIDDVPPIRQIKVCVFLSVFLHGKNHAHAQAGADRLFSFFQLEDDFFDFFKRYAADAFIGLRRPVNGEPDNGQGAVHQLADNFVRQQGPVGVHDNVLDAGASRIIHHLKNILMEERFSPIVHTEMFEPGAFINDLFEQPEVHKPFRTIHALRHIAKSATKVAGVGWLDDERSQFFYFH